MRAECDTVLAIPSVCLSVQCQYSHYSVKTKAHNHIFDDLAGVSV